MNIYLLLPLLFIPYYGTGRLCLAYAEGTKMSCYYEWEHSFAVLLWPFFFMALAAEWVGDAGRCRMKATERRQSLEDAEYKRAMREIERWAP